MPVDAGPLERRLAAAETALADLLEQPLGEIESAKQRSAAAAKVYHLRALVAEDPHDAAKYAAQAAGFESLAIKAAKADLVTRVEALEAKVLDARLRGVGVRELAAQRNPRAKPLGHDPREAAP